MKVNLSKYNKGTYNPGFMPIIIIWYFCNELIMKNSLNPSSSSRKFILKLFGSKIDKNVIIKPGVSVKYPWKLKIGENSWIGENVWIDNLDKVVIEDNVCISQGAMLLSGNHNFKNETFDLIIKPIIVKSGSWIGAKAVICNGAIIDINSIITVNSTISFNTDRNHIYNTNKNLSVKKRFT